MDKYSKILVIDLDGKGNIYLNKIKENGFTNSALIDKRMVRDEGMAMDYIIQFAPNAIVVSGQDEVFAYFASPAEIVGATIINASKDLIDLLNK